MNIPDDEVPAAINDAAHHVAIRVHTYELECVSTAKAAVHIERLANVPNEPRAFADSAGNIEARRLHSDVSPTSDP